MHGIRHGWTPDREALFGFARMTMGGRHGHGHGRHGGHRGRRGFGPGGRAARGDVRDALLLLLAEEPRNGYGLMQEIEARSGGAWRPSPGSVYPILQQLEDEGLVVAESRGPGKVYTLTDDGRARIAERPEGAPAPWDTVGGGLPEGALALRGLLHQVGAAGNQVGLAGTEEQIAEAAKVLGDARRALYRILAEDPPEEVN